MSITTTPSERAGQMTAEERDHERSSGWTLPEGYHPVVTGPITIDADRLRRLVRASWAANELRRRSGEFGEGQFYYEHAAWELLKLVTDDLVANDLNMPEHPVPLHDHPRNPVVPAADWAALRARAERLRQVAVAVVEFRRTYGYSSRALDAALVALPADDLVMEEGTDEQPD